MAVSQRRPLGRPPPLTLVDCHTRSDLRLPKGAPATAHQCIERGAVQEQLPLGTCEYENEDQTGTPLDASHVRRSFKSITKRAGLGENWTPRELRHSFVSIMSDNGVPIETIADLVGHASTAVTEEVYRHQLKPVITRGAETMNAIFKQHQANSA
jgi:integrase